jgi:hypothetical protein
MRNIVSADATQLQLQIAIAAVAAVTSPSFFLSSFFF